MKPQRVQLKRTKGWRMPENTVKVDRTTRWGNPCRVGMFKGYTAADAVADFRKWHDRDPTVRSFDHSFGLPPDIAPLRGKNLACWCALDKPCHADVLLKIANGPTTQADAPARQTPITPAPHTDVGEI